MANRRIRAVGKRREELDIRRLGEALLDLIEHLNDSERKTIAAKGKRALKTKPGNQHKGTAA